jgi:hypothetical protein
MAAAGVPLRTLQEWMGHRDFKTTLIDADYCPSAHETEMVECAFEAGTNSSTNLSETRPRESATEASLRQPGGFEGLFSVVKTVQLAESV